MVLCNKKPSSYKRNDGIRNTYYCFKSIIIFRIYKSIPTYKAFEKYKYDIYLYKNFNNLLLKNMWCFMQDSSKFFIKKDQGENLSTYKKSVEKIDGELATIMTLDRPIMCAKDTSEHGNEDRGLIVF